MHSSTRHNIVWVLAGVFAALTSVTMGGCQSTAFDSVNRPAPTTQAGTDRSAAVRDQQVIAAKTVPTTPLSVEKLSVKVSRTQVFDIVQPDAGAKAKTAADKDSMRVIVRDALPDCHCAGRTWWVREYDGDAAASAMAGVKPTTPSLNEIRMVIDPSGYAAIAERIDHIEKVEVVFSPALVVIPNNLPGEAVGGASYEQEVTMTVHPLGDRTRVKASGKARNVIVYQDDETVSTGAGDFTARKLLLTLTADLSPARVVNISEVWLVDGIGVVAEREQEKTTILGLPSRSNAISKLLNSHVP